MKLLRPYAIAACLSAVSWCLLLGLQAVLRQPGVAHPQYWPDLAWSFLHGRLDLALSSHSHDLSVYKGKVYAYWPPMPAILQMPFVAWTGPARFPQRTFCLILSALNSGLFFLFLHFFLEMLGKTWRTGAKIALAMVYAFGTSNLVFGFAASVWFAGQLVASTFLLVSLWLCVDPRFRAGAWGAALVGTAYAMAFLSRSNLSLALPLVLLLWACAQRPELFRLTRWSEFWKGIPLHRGWPVLLPVTVAIAFQLLYNHARFDNPFEYGYHYQTMWEQARREMAQYGYWGPIYIPRNTIFLLMAIPGYGPSGTGLRAMGFSVFIQCPLLLTTVWRRFTGEIPVFVQCLWASIVVLTGLILCVLFTGWYQFGARYLHDIMPLLFMLAVLKRDLYSGRVWWAAAALSVLINLYGVFWWFGWAKF